ncbi:cyclic nucleotide-binding domain-containing protein [bacterium]|nr:cyclic nucleotide-binding domain-containing protein [bacterium]
MQIEHAEVISILRKTPLFGALDSLTLGHFAGLFRVRTFRAGEIIFDEGGESEAMYVIYDGEIDLAVFEKDAFSAFTTLHRGDFFGEESLLLDDPRFYRAVAVGEVTLLCLDVTRYLNFDAPLIGVEEALEVLVRSRQLSLDLPLDWMGRDEFVHVIARRHPAILFSRMFGPVVLLFSSLFLSLMMLWFWLPQRPYGWILLGVGLPAALGWAVWRYFDWRNDFLILTNKRVVWIEKVALIYDNRQEAPLRTIMSVGISQSRLGGLLGYADVVVQTYMGPIRLHDLARADTLARLVEIYWHNAEDRNRHEEADVMDRKLRQKLDGERPMEEDTRASRRGGYPEEAPSEQEPGFFQWLFSDFLRLRYEAKGAITYRKHWFVLVRTTLLPALLLVLALVIFMIRLTGGLPALPLMPSLIGLGLLMFIFFLWALYQYADWRNDVFQITMDQIIDLDRKPFGQVRRRSAPLENVLSVESDRRGFWGFLFNFGTVYISVGNSRLTFDFVYDPAEVQQDIFYRMGERLDQIRQIEIEAERERVSEWIATYHRRQSSETRPLDATDQDDRWDQRSPLD